MIFDPDHDRGKTFEKVRIKLPGVKGAEEWWIAECNNADVRERSIRDIKAAGYNIAVTPFKHGQRRLPEYVHYSQWSEYDRVIVPLLNFALSEHLA